MPGSVLQMAPLGEPTVKGKTDVLPSRPWVAINEPQLYLAAPSRLFHVSAKGASETRAAAALAEACADGLPAPTCHGHW